MQVTGFSAERGHVGYLREAYHGGPYVTKYLVAEAFAAQGREAAIPAATLRERLPTAVLMHIYREHKLYGGGKGPARIDGIEKLRFHVSWHDLSLPAGYGGYHPRCSGFTDASLEYLVFAPREIHKN
jgi:hypothetical protein